MVACTVPWKPWRNPPLWSPSGPGEWEGCWRSLCKHTRENRVHCKCEGKYAYFWMGGVREPTSNDIRSHQRELPLTTRPAFSRRHVTNNTTTTQSKQAGLHICTHLDQINTTGELCLLTCEGLRKCVHEKQTGFGFISLTIKWVWSCASNGYIHKVIRKQRVNRQPTSPHTRTAPV